MINKGPPPPVFLGDKGAPPVYKPPQGMRKDRPTLAPDVKNPWLREAVTIKGKSRGYSGE